MKSRSICLFCDWLISTTCSQGHKCCSILRNVLLFKVYVVFHHIYHIFYQFICWWTLRLFLHTGFCEYCYSEHGNADTDISLGLWYQCFWKNNQKQDGRFYYIVSFSIFLRNLHIIFHGSFTSLQSYQQLQGFQSLHILTNIYWHFKNNSHLDTYFIVVLMWISPRASVIEHFFTYLLAICMPSLEKYFSRF